MAKSQDLRSQKPKFKKTYPVEHINQQSITDVTSISTEEIEIYRDQNTQERTVMNEKKLDILIPKMIQFCRHDPSAVLIRKFLEQEGIGFKKAREWCKRWPRFEEAYEFAKGAIGCRLFEGALTRVYDGATARPALPIFLEEFKEESERMAKLRLEEKNAEQNKTVKVLIERYTEEEEGRGKNDKEL